MADGEDDDAGDVFGEHFFHDAEAIAFDGSDAEVHFFGNVFIGIFFTDVFDNQPFPFIEGDLFNRLVGVEATGGYETG